MIYWWYRNAAIQDNAVDDGETLNRTASGNTTYHMSHIHPGFREFLDESKEKQ